LGGRGDLQFWGKRVVNVGPLLSILMLSHNDSKFLDGCLQSIAEKVSCSFEVILVDNASSPPVSDDFATRYPWFRVIRSEVNLGFNAGNNLAAKNAKGKYILLLNIDTILLTDVAPAMRLLESGLGVGVVGAESNGHSGGVRPSAGHFPLARRLWLFRSLWARPKVRYGPAALHAYKVDWVEGSFLMTTAENWTTIGGFDEQNFLFGNDIDFCKSTSERGLAVVHCADVRYIHFGGYGVGRMGHLYAGFRGYHRKFSGPAERLTAEIVLRVGLLARILVYGLFFWLTNNARIGEKYRRFADVHRNWAQSAP
jgi:N-acetylglucosaminyl-diphospho-decaprenol L-rhamnosyltransferase